MRIIRGSFKGKAITPPKSFKGRPTTSFARESLFNIIDNTYEYEGLKVLDLCAGSGSISLEFASRGVGSVLAVDIDHKNVAFIRKTANDMNLNQIQAVQADVFRFVKTAPLNYDIIFADPPYEHPEIAKLPWLIFENTSLLPSAMVVIEHSSRTSYANHPSFIRVKQYGKVHFSFFEQKSAI